MVTKFATPVLTITSFVLIGLLSTAPVADTQASFPAPPNDLTRVYYVGRDDKLVPLPFEKGMTSLNVFVPAKKDSIARVVLKGATAETFLVGDNLRFYIFVADKMDPPPHQLVRLASKGSLRELTISVIKGRRGYAPFEVDNVRMEHRILERLRVETSKGRYLFVNYMQIQPLKALGPGEYAIIGDSLSDMATFRVQ